MGGRTREITDSQGSMRHGKRGVGPISGVPPRGISRCARPRHAKPMDNVEECRLPDVNLKANWFEKMEVPQSFAGRVPHHTGPLRMLPGHQHPASCVACRNQERLVGWGSSLAEFGARRGSQATHCVPLDASQLEAEGTMCIIASGNTVVLS